MEEASPSTSQLSSELFLIAVLASELQLTACLKMVERKQPKVIDHTACDVAVSYKWYCLATLAV